MGFLRVLDEVFLRLFLLALRVFQGLITVPTIGLAAAVINDFSSADIQIPRKITAAEAVACVALLYELFTFLPVIWEGTTFFSFLAILDFLLAAAWATMTGVLDNDATDTCSQFTIKYFNKPSQSPDCNIVTAMYAFCIVTL